MKDERPRASKAHKLVIVVLIVIVIGALGYTVLNKTGANPSNQKTAAEQPDKNKYQAVFLTNGQVYFGKLTDNGGNYVKLTDIFYLQSKDQSVQPKDAKAADQSNLTLIKLGKELHAPTDEMNISRQQVLFWENIQDNGKVSQAIKDYKSSNK